MMSSFVVAETADPDPRDECRPSGAGGGCWVVDGVVGTYSGEDHRT
jgi:hypothetical protein